MSDPTSSPWKADLLSLQETLKQVNYQNEMMLRWVNGAVLTVNREGMVIHANKVALQTLGWTEDELQGRHMHETIHHSQDDGSEYPYDFCPVFAAIEDGSSHHVDGDVFWKKDGTSFSVDYIVCPTRSEGNEITGAVLTFRNITQQRQEENKRIHRMKLIAIGELSAGVAHEINTPVQFIGSNIDFLRDSFQDLLQLLGEYDSFIAGLQGDPKLSERIAELQLHKEQIDLEYLIDEAPRAFEQTLEGVERVTELVRGLKGFAHGADQQDKVSTDINEIITNALVVCRNAYKYAAELETDLHELPNTKIFPGDIGQVIINLVVNAAHAIEDQKKKDGLMGKLTITSREKDNNILIEISDTGTGIPDAIKDRVFDPFFTTKSVGQGSGQGLAISHTIIGEKHGGDITFTSIPGKGTTFTITLPIT